uniref:Uncharacterized protein n=1 Tax=Tetraselmis sp. GSL018 TaxID=582737 RepID=A0A061S4N9_9CHLO
MPDMPALCNFAEASRRGSSSSGDSNSPVNLLASFIELSDIVFW